MNTTTPSLRTRIIALGEKGLHRTMLAAYAPKIEAIFQAELQALLDFVIGDFEPEYSLDNPNWGKNRSRNRLRTEQREQAKHKIEEYRNG